MKPHAGVEDLVAPVLRMTMPRAVRKGVAFICVHLRLHSLNELLLDCGLVPV